MNKSEKIRLIYGFFLAALTVIVGIVFIAQIAELYYSGINEGLDVIYTTERINERLILPLVFLCVWIVAIIVGFVLSVVFPIKEKRKIYRDDKKILNSLKSRMPSEGSNEEFEPTVKKIKKLETIRVIIWVAACAVLLVASILIMIYVYAPSNFHSDKLREDVITMVRNIIIWVALGLVSAIAAVIGEGIVTKREIDLVKKAIAIGDKTGVGNKEQKNNKVIAATIITGALSLFAVVMLILAPLIMTWALNTPEHIALIAIFAMILVISGYLLWKYVRKSVPERSGKIMKLCARIAVGVVAVAFIIAGILNSGAGAVLTKAINICTECIGLG